MREPGNNLLKAWSREYDETPFYFIEDAHGDKRLIGWSEEAPMTKTAVAQIIGQMSSTVAVKVRILGGKDDDGQEFWTTYEGETPRDHVLDAIRANEEYVFSDGMHQLWIKDRDTKRYPVFEEHGSIVLHSPSPSDEQNMIALGFQMRRAEPLFSKPHFHHTSGDSEVAEMRFVSQLGLVLRPPI